MGTYTTNYNLFMPTVGETGWGTLVNTNFSTIDSTMKGLNDRITAVENEVNGALSCTSVTTSGKITGNGGIAGTIGTFSGAVTGSTINGATITSTKFNGATIAANGNITAGTYNGVVIKSSGTITVTPTSSIAGYVPVALSGENNHEYGYLTLLPLYGSVKYSGSINFVSTSNTNIVYMHYWTGANATHEELRMSSNTTTNISFTNIPYLFVSGANYDIKFYGFTLT